MNGVPENLENRQMRIQKGKLFLFPASQETEDVAMLLEIMKIMQSN